MISPSHTGPRTFSALFDRHHAAIAGFLRRRAPSPLGEELAAETFLVAFAARERYDLVRADARPWLYGIAANLLRRHQRAEERRLRAYGRAATRTADTGAFDGVDARLDAAASTQALATALSVLGPGERDALLLYAWAELSYEQIAEALGVPVGTVRSRLHRARGVLRELLAPNGEAGDDPDVVAGAMAREENR